MTGGKLLSDQPRLIHMPEIKADKVYTPHWLCWGIIEYFKSYLNGWVLDPCKGDGAFYNQYPLNVSADWCEIDQGRDFFNWTTKSDWIISNPPYRELLPWIRHSFRIAPNIVYLIPIHRVMGSEPFLNDLFAWGGIREIVRIGTGPEISPDFKSSHSHAAIWFQFKYTGSTKWSKLDIPKIKQLYEGKGSN